MPWLSTAIEAVVRWVDGERPTRHVEVEYATPSQDRTITRKVGGRFARFAEDDYSFEDVDLGTVPRRISAPSSETHEAVETPRALELCSEALHAHEVVA